MDNNTLQNTPSSSIGSLSFGEEFPSADAAEMETFLNELHGNTTGYFSFSFLADGPSHHLFPPRTRGSGGHIEVPQEFARWVDDLTRQGKEAYVSMCTVRNCPREGGRTQQKDVIEVPGVWADLDVKGDGFRTRDELDEFLDRLPEATMLINTGSGGVHAYWLFPEPLRGDPGNVENAAVLLQGWHAQLSELTEHGIDNVMETARIMRLAGSTRVLADSGRQTAVRIIKHGGPRYNAADLLAWVRPALDRARLAREERRAAFRQREQIRMSGLPIGDMAYNAVVALFDQTQDWGPLLRAAGWVHHRTTRTGVRQWRQPGKINRGHSTETDYGESGVMSIYTRVFDDPEYDDLFMDERRSPTGFTTKYRFARFFLFHGDDDALIRAIVSRGDGRLF